MTPSHKLLLLISLSTIFIICLIALSIFILNLEPALQTTNPPENSPKGDNNPYVSRVIDGDTFALSDNTTIRLICIDTPEKGKTGYNEAKDFLSELILDKEVRLETDTTDKDEYGRLLRYVYVNVSSVELFVNQQIVQEGYGKVFRFGNDTRRCDEISNS